MTSRKRNGGVGEEKSVVPPPGNHPADDRVSSDPVFSQRARLLLTVPEPDRRHRGC